MTLYKKSVINTGTKLYSHLPENTNTLDQHKDFKKQIKQILLNNSFYSVKEFYQFKGPQYLIKNECSQI